MVSLAIALLSSLAAIFFIKSLIEVSLAIEESEKNKLR